MTKVHEKVLIKKTRYDLNLSIENASKFEQLCEAYDLPKSAMADLIISSFCKGNPVYNAYLEAFRTHKKQLKQRAGRSLFKPFKDDV